MTKKNLIVLASLLMVTSISVGGGLLNSKKVEQVKAEETSASTIQDDEYEVAFMEQFNDGTAYGYSIDRPLETNSLGGHMYGSYDDAVQSNKEYDLKIGVNTGLKWKFTRICAKSDTSTKITYARLQCDSSTGTITNTTAYPEATYPDEYALGQVMAGKSLTRVGAMISKVAIKNIATTRIFTKSEKIGVPPLERNFVCGILCVHLSEKSPSISLTI